MVEIDINNLDVYFQKGELIPAIAFDVDTKTVLMLAYMNKERWFLYTATVITTRCF